MSFIKDKYLTYFLSLLTGTALAQIITFIVSPVLTRIYTPEEFGVFGVYIAICSLLLVFTTGRYEFAINSTKKTIETLSLLKVIILLSFSFSMFVFFILIILMKYNAIQPLWLAIPFTILIMGVNQGLNYTLNKYEAFNTISFSKVQYSIVNALTSITTGLLHIGILGLILSNILALYLSVFNQWKKIHTISNKVNYKFFNKTDNSYSSKKLSKKYINYPLYNVPSAFFEMLAIHAPTFIFIYFYTEAIVGHFNLTLRFVNVPITIIVVTLSQILLSKISELYSSNNKGIKTTLLRVSFTLFLIGLFPSLILFLFGAEIFSLLFGEEWLVAGQMASILSLSFLAKFSISPLSVIFLATQRVKQLSVIQITRSILLLFLLIICASNLTPLNTIVVYSIFEILFHVVYWILIIKLSDKISSDV